MKALLEHILRGILKHPEEMAVVEDVGQVIGKDGRTIKSIKILLSSLSGGEEFTLRVVRP